MTLSSEQINSENKLKTRLTNNWYNNCYSFWDLVCVGGEPKVSCVGVVAAAPASCARIDEGCSQGLHL
jgi:hypothetical protein